MITASVVLFNTPKKQVDSVLESVLKSGAVDLLYVIDNSPNDKWRIVEKKSPVIRYIHNENSGYGESHNLAIKDSAENGARYHIVLNPDVRFESDCIPRLKKFMDENPDASYVLPKVIYPDGRIQFLCKLLPTPADLILRRFLPATKWSGKKNDRYVLKNSGYDRIMNPPCLSGCFMFLRIQTLTENEIFFDEKFFMYFEDFDLIRRLHRISRTIFFPEVTIVHDHAKESYRNPRLLFAHIKSAFRYFNKYGWFFDRERKQMNKKILEEIGER
jgi:hypothetical protein